MRDTRRFALVLAALPLALAGCGSGTGDDAATLESEPVTAIAAPQGGDWEQQVTRTDQGGWLVGNPDAPIKLLEYGSLTCPACANFSVQGAEQLREDYIASGRVSYELRSVLIHGVADLLLTRMLECAPQATAVPLAHQVWSDLDQVIGTFQAAQPQLEQAMSLPEDERFVAMAEAGGLIDYFAARGISTDQARQCLGNSAAIQQLAERTQASATENDVTGTPTFFLNGNRIDQTSWPEVEAALQRAGAR